MASETENIAPHTATPGTGGRPPAACWAPLRPGPRARALLTRATSAGPAPSRARLARELAYADCAATGGRPPEDCYAPAKPRARAWRARARATRELAYENCATTGGRPPEDCYAPAKSAFLAGDQ